MAKHLSKNEKRELKEITIDKESELDEEIFERPPTREYDIQSRDVGLETTVDNLEIALKFIRDIGKNEEYSEYFDRRVKQKRTDKCTNYET